MVLSFIWVQTLHGTHPSYGVLRNSSADVKTLSTPSTGSFLPPRTLGGHPASHCLYRRAFSRMSLYSWHHSFLKLASLTRQRALRAPPCLCTARRSFLAGMMFRVQGATVPLSIRLPRDVLPGFASRDQNCCKHLYSGARVD